MTKEIRQRKHVRKLIRRRVTRYAQELFEVHPPTRMIQHLGWGKGDYLRLSIRGKKMIMEKVA